MQEVVLPYESLLSSDGFLVEGPGGKSFFAHSAVLAKHSIVLGKAINGSMKEAKERHISIKDIDGDIDDATVMRFVEYIYTGTYSLFKPIHKNASDTAKSADIETANTTPAKNKTTNFPPCDSTPSSQRNDPSSSSIFHRPGTANLNTFASEHPKSGSGLFGDSVKSQNHGSLFASPFSTAPVQTKTKSKRQLLWEKFGAQANAVSPLLWKPLVNNPAPSVATPDVLGHAQLYIFANRYECSSLKQLTLQKLRLALIGDNPYFPCSSMIKLIDYTYRHTGDYNVCNDPLRDLVVDYLVCHLENFVGVPSFKELLRQEGTLANDLVTKIIGRLEA